jgi:hypothetical protein
MFPRTGPLCRATRCCVAYLFHSEKNRPRQANVRIGAATMEKDYLVLKRALASRPSGEWSDDDHAVLADGVVVGRIFKVRLGGRTPWMWTLALGHHEDRTPTHGYEATREAAMAAFAKSWRRE